jgi:catechol 2,3-dioxygenase-like lactoylglutathione lyase family enzyme
MHGVVSGAVPVCYVGNLARSKTFYGLFGYAELRSGGDDATAAEWCYLHCGEHALLLATVQPSPIQAELPLLIYFYVDDLAAVRERCEKAGYPVEVVGYPGHAPGGEARTRDPDGNVVLFGQRAVRTGEAHRRRPDDAARASLIQQAAEAISRRGGAPAGCQIPAADGSPCPGPAEVKLADPWGETVWGCLQHTDEALIDARSAFIATEEGNGLGPWLRRRQHARTATPSPPPGA